ncbi:MAG: sugar ABC transporter permease [Lachnospiraceae bacterium]|nr:sugar ABC transporter permease [Lachnospiraceae bacterium]
MASKGQSTVTKPKRRKNVNNAGYFFILPFMIVFVIFSVYPVLRTLYLSFMNYKGFGEPTPIGFANYARVFQDKFFWRALWNTVKIWGVNIVVQLGLAFLLTMVFSDMKYKIKGLGVFRALYYLPNLIAATSVAFLFKTLLDWQYGSFNQILMSSGIIEKGAQIKWLLDPNIAPYVVAIISAWMWFGNSFIVLMAGVQGINTDYFEAASIDGAGRWKTFAKITIPLLKPILIYVSITSLIGGLQMFDIPYLINGKYAAGNPGGSLQTVVMYLYKFGFATGSTKQVGYASAIAYSLFLIILVISIMQFKFASRKDD